MAEGIVNVVADANELMGLPVDDGMGELAEMFALVFGPPNPKPSEEEKRHE